VPISLFLPKDLRRAWFVPLCSEMLICRSVPSTHTSTARGGRIGLRPRGYWTRVLERVLHTCRVPHGAGRLRGAAASVHHGHVRRGHAHGSATARARARRGAYGTPTGRGARTPAHGAASRTNRAHSKLSKLSADSAAGIVPLSVFDSKDLRRAWFVPLCSEMLMRRSVPRTHTSTARGGPASVFVREGTGHGHSRGCCTRALFVPGRRKVLQPCRSAQPPSIVRVRILERSLATHTHGPVLRECAHGGGRGTRAVLADTASRSPQSVYARTTACTARRRR
jgi:hypothetical protein